MDSLRISLCTMRATMAVKSRVKLNWSKFLTKQLHDTTVAIQMEPNRLIVIGQHLTHLIREQLVPIQTNRGKMIKLDGISEPMEGVAPTGQVVVFDPKVEMKRTLQEF